ncbi:MAG TPA: ParM/StbA family protein [Nevskiaceae bacterium]|nr:ParM/StbA family protein [Nevskiaceae bacterium]
MGSAMGLDIGHSAAKVAVDSGEVAIVAAATRAVTLSTHEAEAAAQKDTVSVNGESWLVGDSALVHTLGRVSDGLRDDWISTPEYGALLKAGYDRGSHMQGVAVENVVVGLPSRLFVAQKEKLRTLVSSITQTPAAHVSVLPQPLAAFMVKAIGDDAESHGKGAAAKPDEAAMNESWVVVDVGYYTTDFGFIDRGIWSESAAQSASGVAAPAEAMRRYLVSLGMNASARAASDALRIKSVKYDGEVRDLTKQSDAIAMEFATTVIDQAERVMGERIHSADGILVVGGGADLVFKHIRKRWKHAVVPKNPRFAVAEGMRRAGGVA